MRSPASLSSSPTAAPTGAEADGATLSTLFLLIIIRLLIVWAEGLIASLDQRSETTDLTDITRAFGTTDFALILQRVTGALQRLRALESDILRDALGLAPDPQLNPTTAASTAGSPSAPQPPGLAPTNLPLHPTAKPEQATAAPVRATGPPRPQLSPRKPPRGRTILSHRGAWAAPSCRFPHPRQSRAAA